MAESSWPFDAGAGSSITESQWSEFVEFFLPTGVIRQQLLECQIFADASGMNVKVRTGQAFVRGHYYKNDATLTLTIAASDPTNPRIDRVVLRLDRTANTITAVVIQGTAAASPTAPAITQSSTIWDVSLAQVRVNATVTNIAADKITDERGPFVPLDGTIGINRQAYMVGQPVHPQLNLLVNGGFEIWQRGVGAFTANNAYTADRWRILLGGSSTISVSRDSTNQDKSSQYCAACTYTHNTQSYLLQVLEDYLQLRGRIITFTVRVRTSTAAAVRCSITDGITSSNSGYHSGSGLYETLYVSHAVAAGATLIDVRITLDVTATVYIDNAMLVVGPLAADYVPLHPADDLARCQRYYEVHGGVANAAPVALQYSIGSDNFRISQDFAARKYSTPTLTKNGTWGLLNCSQPSVGFPAPHGYSMLANATASGLCSFSPDSTDDTVTAESNP